MWRNVVAAVKEVLSGDMMAKNGAWLTDQGFIIYVPFPTLKQPLNAKRESKKAHSVGTESKKYNHANNV